MIVFNSPECLITYDVLTYAVGVNEDHLMEGNMTPPTTRPVAVVMGVAGSGKTEIGTRLARRLGIEFVDGDDLHPAANVAKMSAGHALNDDDRRPWLETIGGWLADHRAPGGIAACSALKRSYRDLLRSAVPGLPFIHLTGNRDLMVERVGNRTGHYMPASLVDSQFATLEPLGEDEAGLTLDVDTTIEALVSSAQAWLTAHR